MIVSRRPRALVIENTGRSTLVQGRRISYVCAGIRNTVKTDCIRVSRVFLCRLFSREDSDGRVRSFPLERCLFTRRRDGFDRLEIDVVADF